MRKRAMDQEKMWDFYQTSTLADHFFPEVRQRYLISFLTGGEKVLNIGVGSGALEKLALRKGVDIWCIDPSAGTIEKVRNELNLGEKARVGYSHYIPFDNEMFDVVVMAEVIEHLQEDVLSLTMKEIFRVLKAEGRLLLTTPYREILEDSLVVCPKCGNVFHRFGHVQSFDKYKLKSVLVQSGFRIQQIKIVTFVDWKRRNALGFIKSSIRWLLAKMKQPIADPHLFAIAYKHIS